ncbi:hypothetical protein GCM10023347_40160 [Streptomyces chumphonensis]|uniref:Uncharacterized protein n=1 Tax=Streptomyces chumphonensis TaxID=1214925 RepID=A0A927IB00_9ACTN|nr:hypothetical protein [Streptomyces chumphonensis]MBD3930467.1 hypothetical protein [Streptomyces chumphonensis]
MYGKSDVASELVKGLSAAGLDLVEVVGEVDDLLPALVARYVTQLFPEDGRQDVLLRHGTPHLTARLNEEWERTAVASGLFGDGRSGERTFLVGIEMKAGTADEEDIPAYRWARVTLSEGWDIAGAGCASGVLGTGRNNPTFAMASVRGDVLMVAGYWQVGVGFAVISQPEHVSRLRDHARRIAAFPHVEPATREWADRWLTAHPQN